MNTPFQIAISPCPNDTFLFHAWIQGIVGRHIRPECQFADIELLNRMASKKQFQLIKISIHSLGKLYPTYRLLPVGTALGYHCGPKIIASRSFDLQDLTKKRIAIPGFSTTASFLLDLLAPKPLEKIVIPYHEILDAIHSNKVDCGLIIHESRFTFQKANCVEIADLGSLWDERFHLPLPLGGIAVREDVNGRELIEILQDSLQFAWQNPEKSRSFVLSHSQEKNSSVVDQHIALYVNQDTYLLSQTGRQAIDLFFEKAEQLGLYSKPENWLYQ